jgi:hypothetical protein
MFQIKEEKASKLVKLGRSKFVLLFGVLLWGLPTAILFALTRGYLDGWDSFLPQLIIALILFPLGGILWGRIMWKLLVRKNGSAAR